MDDEKKLLLIKTALKKKIDTISTLNGFKAWLAQVTRSQIRDLIKVGLQDMREEFEAKNVQNEDLESEVDGFEV